MSILRLAMIDSRSRTLRIALATLLSASGVAHAVDPAPMPAERALATFALTGVRLSAEQSTMPTVTPEIKRCVVGIRPETLVPTYRRMLELTLSPDEIAATEAIYGGPLGQKLVVSGVALGYRHRGLAPPDGDATFSPEENAVLMKFVSSPAGDKLLRQGVLDSGEPLRLLNARLDVLFAACRDASRHASAPN